MTLVNDSCKRKQSECCQRVVLTPVNNDVAKVKTRVKDSCPRLLSLSTTTVNDIHNERQIHPRCGFTMCADATRWGIAEHATSEPAVAVRKRQPTWEKVGEPLWRQLRSKQASEQAPQHTRCPTCWSRCGGQDCVTLDGIVGCDKDTCVLRDATV